MGRCSRHARPLDHEYDNIRAALQWACDGGNYTIGLLGLGDVARDQGDVIQIRTYCDESLAILRELGVQWAIGYALNNLALAVCLDDGSSQTLALVSESVVLFRSIKNDGAVTEVLVTLGHILRAQGEAATAYEALNEALRLALAVGPRLLVAITLEGLASLVVQREQSALALRLLGVAALRVQMGTPVRPIDKPAIDQTLATAKAALGADAFATVWTATGALSLEHVLNTLPDAASFSAQLMSGSSSGAVGFTDPDIGRVD